MKQYEFLHDFVIKLIIDVTYAFILQVINKVQSLLMLFVLALSFNVVTPKFRVKVHTYLRVQHYFFSFFLSFTVHQPFKQVNHEIVSKILRRIVNYRFSDLNDTFLKFLLIFILIIKLIETSF